MRHHRNAYHCHRFGRQSFLTCVGQASGVPLAPDHEQAQALLRLLGRLGAVSFVQECHYVDRHFMEEHSAYYSRCLTNPPNFCSRLHFFIALGRPPDDQGADSEALAARVAQAPDGALDASLLDDLLRFAADGCFMAVRRLLADAYLGYVVVRPLPGAPFGRTVLPSDGDEPFPTEYHYTVHFLGFELPAFGLPFEQQDRAVAACATTAAWISLQRVCRQEGHRPPTPTAIAEAASRHSLPVGRALPTPGLTTNQICEALSHFGFAPHVYGPQCDPKQFVVSTGIYVRSGIPVIWTVGEGDSGHAVAVAGVAGGSDYPCPVELKPDPPREVIFRQGLYARLYLHDDARGPYQPADVELSAGRVTIAYSCMQNGRRRRRRRTVKAAIAPLYPKLRMNADELFHCAREVARFLTVLLSPDQRFELGAWFDRAGSYQASLYALDLEAESLARFQRRVALSRYVAVLRWSVEGHDLLDTVWDTTDLWREGSAGRSLLAAVVLDRTWPGVSAICRVLERAWDVITSHGDG